MKAELKTNHTIFPQQTGFKEFLFIVLNVYEQNRDVNRDQAPTELWFSVISTKIANYICLNPVFFTNLTASINPAIISFLKLLFDSEEGKVISHPNVSLLNCPIGNEKVLWNDCSLFVITLLPDHK